VDTITATTVIEATRATKAIKAIRGTRAIRATKDITDTITDQVPFRLVFKVSFQAKRSQSLLSPLVSRPVPRVSPTSRMPLPSLTSKAAPPSVEAAPDQALDHLVTTSDLSQLQLQSPPQDHSQWKQ